MLIVPLLYSRCFQDDWGLSALLNQMIERHVPERVHGRTVHFQLRVDDPQSADNRAHSGRRDRRRTPSTCLCTKYTPSISNALPQLMVSALIRLTGNRAHSGLRYIKHLQADIRRLEYWTNRRAKSVQNRKRDTMSTVADAVTQNRLEFSSDGICVVAGDHATPASATSPVSSRR